MKNKVLFFRMKGLNVVQVIGSTELGYCGGSPLPRFHYIVELEKGRLSITFVMIKETKDGR